MEIKFDSLKEIKEFILMVDMYQLCEKMESWGGLGYTIENTYYDQERKMPITVSEPTESKVDSGGSGYHIVTTYYKQLSWLFYTLCRFVEYNEELDSESFLEGFHVACEGYFIINPDHTAKELMIFIVDSLKRLADSKQDCSNYRK